MLRALFILLVVAAALGPPSAADVVAEAGARTPPNVLVLVLDDIGVEKVGAYGAASLQGATPNLDAFAEKATLFRRAWACPQCSPTRAAALTGKLPSRTGMGNAVTTGDLSTHFDLPLSETLLPEALVDTHAPLAFGKWHLTRPLTAGVPFDHPLRSGFAVHAGAPANPTNIRLGDAAGSYYSWVKAVQGELMTTTTYATTDTTNDLLVAIDGAAAPEPWFVWGAFNAAHKPLHVPPPSLLDGEVPDDDDLSMYLAMVRSLDAEVGRVLDAVDLSDTVVVVFGDNGTHHEFVGDGDKERGKGSVFESGVRVPLMVAGPGIAAGARTDALAHVVDLFPTILELTDHDVPAGLDGVSLVPALRDAAAAPRDVVYTERFKPNGVVPDGTNTTLWKRAIRDGRYKLVEDHDPQLGVTLAMYDLLADPFEADDLLDGGLDAESAPAFDALLAELAWMTHGDQLRPHPAPRRLR